MQTLLRIIPDEAATLAAGEAIGHLLSALPASTLRFQVNLIGDLGAGKTTLVRGVLRGLGHTGRVKSPTYPLLETYSVGMLNLAHFDLYRLESPDGFTEAGFEDIFAGPGIRFVEWPDRAGDRLAIPDWRLTLVDTSEGGRQMTIDAVTPMGAELLERLAV